MVEIPASYRKLGSRNTMVTSDFIPEVEISVSRMCRENKNMQYNPYYTGWAKKRTNFERI